MKKKVLALILTLAMVMSMFAGCGKKDSSYFKELKDICKITTGTQTIEFNVAYKADDSEDIPAFLKDKDGKAIVTVKMESTMESQTKGGVKISAKLGQENDFSEVATMVISDKTVYITVDKIVAFVKKLDADMASQLESSLAQMGISGSISIDLEKIMEALGEKYPTATEDLNKSAAEILDELFKALENNYKDLEGEAGDDYTLTVNSDTADKAVTGTVNFLKNDAQGLLEKVKELIKKIYGDDSENMALMVEQYDEMIKQLPSAAKTVEDSRDDIVKTIKDNKLNIVSKASEDDGEGKITFESGKIKDENTEMEISMNCNFKEGKAEIKGMIPEDSSDVTTMLVTLINQMSQLSQQGIE